MKSLRETLRRLTGGRAPHRDSADILRTLATLRFALNATGMSLDEFGRKHVDRSRASSANLVHRWARAKTSMRASTAKRLDKRVPGVLRVYSHPVFELLRERCPTLPRINRLLKPYRPDGYISWWFGDEQERGVVASPLRTETSLLAQRGDLEGFTVILGLLREAEVKDDLDAHISRLGDLYRAFPGAARVSWLKPFAPLLRYCVQTLSICNLYSAFWWRVDWKLIQRQTHAARHETVRHRCPRDPKTLEFILPADPVSVAIEGVPDYISNPLKKKRWAAKAVRAGDREHAD
jgi:hypothetical protein